MVKTQCRKILVTHLDCADFLKSLQAKTYTQNWSIWINKFSVHFFFLHNSHFGIFVLTSIKLWWRISILTWISSNIYNLICPYTRNVIILLICCSTSINVCGIYCNLIINQGNLINCIIIIFIFDDLFNEVKEKRKIDWMLKKVIQNYIVKWPCLLSFSF